MPIYTLTPQAELRLPDPTENQRLVDAWPLPSLLYDALHAALHQAFPQVQLWEQTHPCGRNGHYASRKEKGERFGSLTLAGPFPCREDSLRRDWYFPRPADVMGIEVAAPNHGISQASTDAGDTVRNQAGPRGITLCQPIKEDPGHGNLPAPLQHTVANSLAVKVKPAPAWWSKPALEAYLRNECPATDALVDSRCLYAWDGEVRRVYPGQPEFNPPMARAALHLADNISLGFHASMPLVGEGNREGLECLITSDAWPLRVGSGSPVSRLHKLSAQPTVGGLTEPAGLEQFLPLSVTPTGPHVKWVLLSPAVFPLVKPTADGSIRFHPGGWLPNWICPETGRVLLKQGQTARQPGESRADWRRRWRQLPDIDCRLVAARIPNPLILGGWSERLRSEATASVRPGPKVTCLAVPSGAVYYFVGPEAPVLSGLLSWHGTQRENLPGIIHRRSSWWGEKGFGLGVCGPWNYLDL